MCTPPARLTWYAVPLQVSPEEVTPTTPDEEVTGSKATVKVMPFLVHEHEHFTTELVLTDEKAARAAQWASKCRHSAFGMPMGPKKAAASSVAPEGEMVTKAKSSEHCGQVMMPTVAKPDEITDTLKAPTLNDKTALIKKMAESKVSLDADAVPVHSVPHPHAAHSRPSIPGLPCPIHSRIFAFRAMNRAMNRAKPEMPYRPEFDTKITVGVPEFIKAISNGNERKAPPFLPFETTVAMYEDVIAEASKPERQEQLKAINANAEFNAVRKAHKRELLFSEICLAALKKHGFTSGVDVKKTLRHDKGIGGRHGEAGNVRGAGEKAWSLDGATDARSSRVCTAQKYH